MLVDYRINRERSVYVASRWFGEVPHTMGMICRIKLSNCLPGTATASPVIPKREVWQLEWPPFDS